MLVRMCCIPNVRYWVSGLLTIKPHGGTKQTGAGSQEETRCLWHPRWLWFPRPAFLISPDCGTCHVEHEGTGSHCTVCLLVVQWENPSLIHPDKHTLQGRCYACEAPRHVYTRSTYPCVSAEWTKAKLKANRNEKIGCWSSFHKFTKIPLEQQCGRLIAKMSSVQKKRKREKNDPLQYDLRSLGHKVASVSPSLESRGGRERSLWLALIKRTRQM